MPREKKNSAGTSHQGFPWRLLFCFVALKGKKRFFILLVSLPKLAKLRAPRSDVLSCDQVHWGILCGFLLLSPSRASRIIVISRYQLNFLSGYLLKLAIPAALRNWKELKGSSGAPSYWKSKSYHFCSALLQVQMICRWEEEPYCWPAFFTKQGIVSCM